MMVVCDCCGKQTPEPVASQLYEGATICPECAEADKWVDDPHDIEQGRIPGWKPKCLHAGFGGTCIHCGAPFNVPNPFTHHE